MPPPRWPLGLTAAASVVTAASTFGPWLHSGRTVRTSYGVARALDRLDVAHGLVGSAVGGLWSFVPLLAALVVLGAVVRRPLAVAAGGVALGLGVAAFAAGVLASPFPPGWGAYLGIVGSTVTFAAALGTMASGSAGAAGRPTHADPEP